MEQRCISCPVKLSYRPDSTYLCPSRVIAWSSLYSSLHRALSESSHSVAWSSGAHVGLRPGSTDLCLSQVIAWSRGVLVGVVFMVNVATVTGPGVIERFLNVSPHGRTATAKPMNQG